MELQVSIELKHSSTFVSQNVHLDLTLALFYFDFIFLDKYHYQASCVFLIPFYNEIFTTINSSHLLRLRLKVAKQYSDSLNLFFSSKVFPWEGVEFLKCGTG